MPTYRTSVRHDGPWVGAPGFNVWHFRTTGVADEAASLQLAADRLEDFYSALQTYFTSGDTHVHDGEWVEVEDASLITSTPWSVSHTGGGPRTPAQTCIVAGWQTSVRSRRGRGRTFLGPPDDITQETNGTIKEAQRAGIVAAGRALIAAFDGDQGAFGVYSQLDGVIRDFTDVRVRNTFAHLTSRRV